LLELHWTLARKERLQFVVVVVGLVALSVLVAMGTAIFVAVRPLLRRIARLRQATQRLGQSAGYASAADPEADDLGQLSILLDQAHTRIAADAERATNRQKALEEHLANVAHDLRTPLASLQLTIEHLASEAERHQQGLIRGAIDDIVYMGALIENLYLACRLEEGADPLAGNPRVDLVASSMTSRGVFPHWVGREISKSTALDRMVKSGCNAIPQWRARCSRIWCIMRLPMAKRTGMSGSCSKRRPIRLRSWCSTTVLASLPWKFPVLAKGRFAVTERGNGIQPAAV
jgi:hypothetical protein